jgi:hypothetical protein
MSAAAAGPGRARSRRATGPADEKKEVTSLTPALVTTVRAAWFPT